MAKIGVFFSAGYEEIEALTVVDLCRRAGIEVTMVSVDETAAVTGSHQITVQMDQLLSETDFDAFDLLVLPGGMPGTLHLEACDGLMEQLDRFYSAGKWVAAICAAPQIFGHRGYLKGVPSPSMCCATLRCPCWSSVSRPCRAIVIKKPVPRNGLFLMTASRPRQACTNRPVVRQCLVEMPSGAMPSQSKEPT